MKITARLVGFDALSLKVKYLRDAARWGLKAGTSEAAGMLEQEAKAHCPVDTGRAQNAIHTETLEDRPELQVLMVTPAHASDNEYGFDPPYVRRLELGFVGQDKLGRMYHQAPQPYMRPAGDVVGPQVPGVIKENILSELQTASNIVAAKRFRRS